MEMNTPILSIPVFMYHEVVDDSPRGTFNHDAQYGPYYLSRSLFEEHLICLRDEGFKTIDLPELTRLITCATPPDKAGKYCVITFDDGYSGNYAYAFPLLKKYGFTATFFVTAGTTGSEHMMDWLQLKEMSDGGMQVESHTLTHPFLRQLDEAGQRKELVDSKLLIEAHTGKPVHFISLPNGSRGSHFREIAIAAGYLGACNSTPGFNTSTTDIFDIPRFTVLKEMKAAVLANYLYESPTVYWLVASKKIRMRIRSFIGEKTYNFIFRFLTGLK
jgi:peptidoglycan/xylan/chitin deacetylase (PgdA/CDA1 family)